MKKTFALLAIAMASLSLSQAEEVVTEVIGDGISHKWEIKASVGGMLSNYEGEGYAANTKWGESLQYEVGAGYNFNSNFYLGISSGYYDKFGFTAKYHQNNKIMPVLGDIVYRWNKWDKWSIFAEARAGYLFNFEDVKKVADGTEYDPVGYTTFEIMPGVYYRLRPNIDLRFSLGFAYGITNEEGQVRLTQNEKGLIAKLGMNFRTAPKMEIRTTILEDPVIETDTIVLHDTIYVPQPVRIVETTTPEQKSLGEREVVIFYTIRMHNILPEKDELLMEMALFTKTHKTSKIILKSYADKGTGNYQLNQMYSRNRMNEVKKHLVEKYGINPDQIEASYYGDTVQPFEENDLNRCSIITVKEVE